MQTRTNCVCICLIRLTHEASPAMVPWSQTTLIQLDGSRSHMHVALSPTLDIVDSSVPKRDFLKNTSSLSEPCWGVPPSEPSDQFNGILAPGQNRSSPVCSLVFGTTMREYKLDHEQIPGGSRQVAISNCDRSGRHYNLLALQHCQSALQAILSNMKLDMCSWISLWVLCDHSMCL